MASNALACSASPFVSNASVAKTPGRTSGPCSVFFPSSCGVRRPLKLRAQAASAGGGGDHNKDTSVDVHHVSTNQGNTSSNQSATAVERRPRRMAALDVPSFGKSNVTTIRF